MNILWVQIRSFHALSDYQGIPRTLCGRSPSRDSEVYDTLPAGKSCETCAVIIARRVDREAKA